LMLCSKLRPLPATLKIIQLFSRHVAGGRALWTDIMMKHSTDENIQVAGVYALYKLAEHGPRHEVEENFIPSCFDILFGAMNAHPESSRLSEYCCGAFCILTTYEKGIRLLDDRIVKLITEAIFKYQGRLGLISKVTGLMCNLALSNSDFFPQLKSTELRDHLIKLEEQHKGLANLVAAVKHFNRPNLL